MMLSERYRLAAAKARELRESLEWLEGLEKKHANKVQLQIEIRKMQAFADGLFNAYEQVRKEEAEARTQIFGDYGLPFRSE